jgi:UDP-3-O-[3-hydroxymyristoyl] glucosamine N-acyltransferase
MAEVCSLEALAELTGSLLKGNAQLEIASVAAVEHATLNDISYIRGGKYRHYLQSTQAGALILPPDLAAGYTGNCLINPDPYLAYAKVVARLYPVPCPPAGIHPTAVIAQDVILGEGCSIGAHVVIDAGTNIGSEVVIESGCVIGLGCQIGDNTRLYPNVTLGYNTHIGERCILHSGAVLGADGFGFAPAQNEWYKINQIGNVVLGNDVEIGANTAIDRAAIGSTVIGNGVKLDNLIQVGHNVQIGDHSAIAGCTAIAGSVKIGNYCRIGGACAINGHLEIADHVTVTGMTMVSHSIRHKGVYSSGVVQDENQKWRKNAARFNQLDTMYRRLRALEKQFAEIPQENDKDKG